ncbi:MAG TPA: hemolysin family protein [Chloroflexota bacterium]|nr:hemolysin family protein [Chloroflexota bacterium]
MSSDGTSWQIVALVLCLLLAAFASLAETSLTSLGKIRIRHLAEEGSRSARLLLNMLDDPGHFLSTILVVNNVAVIVASTLTTLITVKVWHFSPADAAATAMLSVVILVFCEITPKTIAIRRPERIALGLARPVRAASWLLGWLIAVLSAIPPLVLHLFGAPNAPKSPFVTEEEIRMIVGTAEEEGVIEPQEERMIHSIFEFGETPVREVMVPRVDMTTVSADTPLVEVVDLMLQVGHSRIPVHQETVDNILGLVFDRDLFKYLREGQTDVPLKDAVRPAYFVPESKKVDELLHELQKKRVQMALVVDEYGGIAGLVTIEDILEEIVGEIQDEFDAEETSIQQISEDEAEFNALLSVEDVNHQLDLSLDAGDADTLGGYVYAHLGKMPVTGDEFAVADAEFTVQLKVIATDGRRIRKVRVLRQHRADVEKQGQNGQAEPA